jgi:hypothetical protein
LTLSLDITEAVVQLGRPRQLNAYVLITDANGRVLPDEKLELESVELQTDSLL